MAHSPEHSVRGNSLRLTLACDLNAVRTASRELRSFLDESGLSLEEAGSCELAMVEACNNAIAYAEGPGLELPIQLIAICEQNLVEIRVEDHTLGFDWPERVFLPDDDSESGRGLFLICSLMDEAWYLRGRTSNWLVMRKTLEPQPSSAVLVGAAPPTRVAELERRLAEDERVIRDMGEELSSCYESLSAIFRYSKEQMRTVGIDDFSTRLLDDLLRVTGNDWYVFRLWQPNPGVLVPFTSSEKKVLWKPLRMDEAGEAPTGLEARVAKTHREEFFEKPSDLLADDPLSEAPAGSVGLVHPVCLGDDLVGTLAVGGKPGVNRFTAARLSVIQTFADFLAIQLVNTRFQEEKVRNLLVAQEIRIATQIQRSLLPATLPQPPGFGLAATCENAKEVGGDFYDVISLEGERWMIVLGDVMGKGLPSAMFAMILRSLIRASSDQEPAKLLERINGLLYEELSKVEMFITAQVALLDPTTSELTLASAGHCPALVCGPSGKVDAYSPEGMPLGVLPDTLFEEISVPLLPGSNVLLYTDGVTETVCGGGGMFGQKRLMEWLARETSECLGPDALRERLLRTLVGFQGNSTLSDDQTFVILGCAGGNQQVRVTDASAIRGNDHTT